ncbi:sulfatase-like hydrolase/transferase [Radiobacillus sp. PE A8.2]|uniref:sulfatase-like hydrolase/transferase n=1 Tax=Radiobacillus sp. PE A8.2 TaxID=3380349 RepID=UPI00388D32F5
MSHSNEKWNTGHKKRPNFLFFVVDEERFPSVYENEQLRSWQKENLKTQQLLRENGMTFLHHYIGSTACSPSRATLFTGQYPSLHGVSQTAGAAKGAFDPDMFWLDANTVPTLGDYFRAGGYKTFWKGKWHISEQDILIPGTYNALPSYNTVTGVPERDLVQEYLNANRLDSYGFSGWIGPEPHGSNPRNSASSAAIGVSGRDVVYADEVVRLIETLDKQAENGDENPWLVTSSFVNPHDIALFGLFARLNPSFDFEIDPSVPFIPPAPTADETLLTKPLAQRNYREVYPQALQPTKDSLFYRQLYYSLQKRADQNMYKVFQALKQSRFYEDTIVVFTSDHGDLLGSHGGLFQKWYNVYEESIHVPFIIHSPKLFSSEETTDTLTSHVDIIPTLLGLADIDVNKVQRQLSRDHTEVHPLVGRDLTPLLYHQHDFDRANEPLYFMTDDDVTKGLNQVTITGEPYQSVIQPNHIETVITKLRTGENNQEEIWKYSRYFDNPQFWSNPGVANVDTKQTDSIKISDNTEAIISVQTTKTEPVPDQYELYNLTKDPFEEINLAHFEHKTEETKMIEKSLKIILEEQCRQKRLYPTSGNVPGKPSCN